MIYNIKLGAHFKAHQFSRESSDKSVSTETVVRRRIGRGVFAVNSFNAGIPSPNQPIGDAEFDWLLARPAPDRIAAWCKDNLLTLRHAKAEAVSRTQATVL